MFEQLDLSDHEIGLPVVHPHGPVFPVLLSVVV